MSRLLSVGLPCAAPDYPRWPQGGWQRDWQLVEDCEPAARPAMPLGDPEAMPGRQMELGLTPGDPQGRHVRGTTHLALLRQQESPVDVWEEAAQRLVEAGQARRVVPHRQRPGQLAAGQAQAEMQLVASLGQLLFAGQPRSAWLLAVPW